MTPYQIAHQNFESLVDKEINVMIILRVILWKLLGVDVSGVCWFDFTNQIGQYLLRVEFVKCEIYSLERWQFEGNHFNALMASIALLWLLFYFSIQLTNPS